MTAGAAPSHFPAIGSYGFLSDCHTSALVAPDGSVEWFCAPRFDSPSVFASILDRTAGHFRVGPFDETAPLSRRYEPGTLVMETTWTTETGWVVVRDALSISSWAEQGGPRELMTGHETDHCLVRFIECVDGEVDMEMVCRPRFNYGAEAALWTDQGLGEAIAEGAGEKIALATDLNLTLEQGQATARMNMKQGDGAFVCLSWGEGIGPHPRSFPEAKERLESSRNLWREWLAQGSFPDHPWRIHLQRSALVLKGLTYTPTGAMLAAATTSLPETPGGERNWDYRFSWIRDSTFALWSMHSLGFEQEARDFMRFVRDRALESNDAGIQIMYGIGGEHDLTEHLLDHLSGYGGAKPVRTGNGAFDQRQNDVWGALLDSIYVHRRAIGPEAINDQTRKLVKDLVENALEAWPKPDQGIWEARGEPQHYVSSKLMIWVAVDRGARLANEFGRPENAEMLRGKADEIKQEIIDRGLRDGVFRQHYDTDALDASVLLMPLVRFLPPDDPRIRDTVLAIREGLDDQGLILRYVTDETDDGLHGEEGTFLICSFWMVAALSEIGEKDAARKLCERLLAASGDLDLYAEELEAASNRHLGNFPQAFTHLALINAVSHVIADERRGQTAPGTPTAVFTEIREMD
ncbi:MAG: glycoside hydrolase family 15 protein [Solirubrobacterales bacterium]|nr:glycoside hydrolase family 15 protein [Solirubrobacterales bacterium]